MLLKLMSTIGSMRIKRRDLRDYSIAVFAGSTFLGVLSFGSLILLLFPVTFAIGFLAASVTLAPLFLFLIVRAEANVLWYVVPSLLIGFFCSASWLLISHFFNERAIDSFLFVVSMHLSLYIGAAYGISGLVFYYLHVDH